jgi:predicted RNase H-like HicB family nuclease
MRQVLIYPGLDGYWIAECPSLPGCITQGATRKEAVVNIREAIELYIAALDDDGLPVPSATATRYRTRHPFRPGRPELA